MTPISLIKQLPKPPVSLLAKPLQLIPYPIHAKILEPALNKLLALPIAEGELDFLEGRWLTITITDLKLSAHIGFDGQRINVAKPEQTDAHFKGKLSDFIILAYRQEDPDTLFFQRRLAIEGDTELGLALKNLLDGLDNEQLPATITWLLEKSERLHKALYQGR